MTYALREHEAAFFERELASFVPDRVFDAHCHLWPAEHDEAVWNCNAWGEAVGFTDYRARVDLLHPGRDVAAMFLPLPEPNAALHPAQNDWITEQTHADPTGRSRGSYFVRPGDDPALVREQVRMRRLHGLKCYHNQAATKPTWEADIEAFLPEDLVAVADELGLTITLHMVKRRAVADPANIATIRRYCETYPNMRLILAHSARGFCAAHNVEGLPHLRGLDNLWFDTSANCDPMAHIAIIKTCGHERLMYGSDFHISHMRGLSLTAADGFLWLYDHTPVWGEKQGRVEPVMVGLEHLRSIKWACWSLGLSDGQIEDIFWNNAARLFDVR